MREKSEKANFTERFLSTLAIPKTRQTIYDARVAHLGIKLEPSGKRVFFWFRSVAGKPTWKKIGEFPATSVESARATASKWNGDLDRWRADGSRLDQNPFDETRRGEPTVSELLEDYIARQIRAYSAHPDDAEEQVRKLAKYFVDWNGRKLSEVSRKNVIDLHASIGEKHGHYQANRVLQTLRAMFNHALKTELWKGTNPAAKIKLFAEIKRKRFIERSEMPKFFQALATEPNKDLVDFIFLALWTGIRKADILSAKWSDISIANNRWTIPDPKGGIVHSYVVAIVPEVSKILRKRFAARNNDSPWLFPSWGKTGHVVDFKSPWKKLLQRCGLENLIQHDLRRTFGSWQAEDNSSLTIIGESLGHAAGSPATAVYARVSNAPVVASVARAVKGMIAASKSDSGEIVQALAGGIVSAEKI